jgi:hypothetical protein
LIDITVRPAYAGGISNVLHAFNLARTRVSVSGMMTLLEKLDYTYPYHQSIGFYLTRAGYHPDEQALAAKSKIEFDFYLGHRLKNPAFDSRWRTFFPQDLK